jgi:hypothetical protein
LKPIKSVEYIDINVQTNEVECHVTFFDDTHAVFYEEEDLEHVKRQIWVQSKPGTRITV